MDEYLLKLGYWLIGTIFCQQMESIFHGHLRRPKKKKTVQLTFPTSIKRSKKNFIPFFFLSSQKARKSKVGLSRKMSLFSIPTFKRKKSSLFFFVRQNLFTFREKMNINLTFILKAIFFSNHVFDHHHHRLEEKVTISFNLHFLSFFLFCVPFLEVEVLRRTFFFLFFSLFFLHSSTHFTETVSRSNCRPFLFFLSFLSFCLSLYLPFSLIQCVQEIDTRGPTLHGILKTLCSFTN